MDSAQKRRTRAILILGIFMIFAWAPWITEERAFKLVTDHLGGETPYNYLGETTLVKNVPKSFVKLPFIALVYFPGEAVYIVTFFGWVI
ncbi:MAG: hypothetical protein ACXABG_10600 [Promethearchaeota archaeon]|jgi:hypothetical protein